jgi:S1-C subfamily serine protease
MNWDGTVAGVPNGDQRRFDCLEEGTPPPPVSSLMSGLSEMSCGNTAAAASVPAQQPVSVVPNHLKPFARVDAIAAESPAHTSGLREEDLIVEFGYLNMENHNHLKAIAELVPDAAADKQSISLTVLRRRKHEHECWDTLKLSLSPKPWPGRGLIGCHLIPYTE